MIFYHLLTVFQNIFLKTADDCFSKYFFKNILLGTLSESNSMNPNQAGHFVGPYKIWVQTVCKDQQLMTKFAAGWQRVKSSNPYHV